MGSKILQEGFTFDDVLIRPAASSIEPAEAKLNTTIAGLPLAVPFLSAAMDKVTESTMAIALGKLGGIGVLHRNCSIEEQAAMVQEAKRAGVAVAAACGPFAADRAEALDRAGVDAIVIDCAHGHNLKVIESAREIKKKLHNAKLIFGNIATAEAAKEAVAFADAVKVGVGPGSICTTRIVTGCGMPQMTAIMECIQITRKKGIPLIADGGIKYSGDITKALAAGADSVMIGNLFAGTDESPGESVLYQGRSYKVYRGMGSLGAMQMGSTDRYQQSSSTPLEKLVPEGIEGMVPYKGKLSQSVYQLLGGIRSGMGYVGARTISELHEKAKFVRVSPSGHKESHVHDVLVTKEAPNYRIET